MSGFFQTNKSSWKRNATKQTPERNSAREFARRLQGLLRQRGSVSRRLATKSSVEIFEKLIRRYTREEVDRVLAWYERNIGRKWVPVVWRGAEQFAEKFGRIEAAMRRSVSEEESSDTAITYEARWVAERIGLLSWPIDKTQSELLAIQVSLNNYRRFVEKLYVGNRPEMREEDHDVLNCLLARLPLAPNFVAEWFSELHRMVWSENGFERWSGDLFAHRVREDSERFRRKVNELLVECRSDGEWWPWLEKLLKKGDEFEND